MVKSGDGGSNNCGSILSGWWIICFNMLWYVVSGPCQRLQEAKLNEIMKETKRTAILLS